MSHSLSSSGTNSSLKAPSTVTDQELCKSAPFSISLVQECSAIKKGLLWEQQQNKFFFNRWKERFFILTTDYLTCFKKGSKKVGMSEMGSFVYKINLNEIKNLSWIDKKKNGVIGVQMENNAIFLWINTEKLLDEWMVALQESTSRTKGRREALRKSATLLPSLMTSTSAHFSPIDFIQRNHSPNLSSSSFTQRSNTPSDLEMNGGGCIPPPPPPRRYLRCLSTDQMSSSLEEKKLNTTTGFRNKTDSKRLLTTAAIANNTFHKLNDQPHHRLSSGNMSTGGGVASQSLRCKSSYAIQLSPLLIANSPPPSLPPDQTRRGSTTRRLSSMQQIHQRPQSQSVFQSADSEFAFIPTKSLSIKPNRLDGSNRNSYYPHSRNSISSSASLMLNSRSSKLNGEHRGTPPPPPIPPHRTHLHHF